MNQGGFSLDWLLDPGETEESVKSSRYIQDEEVKEFLEKAYKGDVDPLYLVKWR